MSPAFLSKRDQKLKIFINFGCNIEKSQLKGSGLDQIWSIRTMKSAGFKPLMILSILNEKMFQQGSQTIFTGILHRFHTGTPKGLFIDSSTG